MQPLRIKASGTPITSANFQGLQEMTDGQINQYLSYVITNKFATDTDGTGTAELNVDTANALTGTSIGTWTNTIRNDAIGTHPTTGETTDTTYYFKQVTSAAAESITSRPVGYDAGIKEFNDASLDTDVLDKVIEDMVTSTGYTVGQYSLAASAPVGGTWTSRATITDSNQGGSTTLYLWQKTAPSTSAIADFASLKLDGTNVKMMSAAEIEQMVPNFRNRIIDSGIGTYKLQATAPVEAGTWTQMGDSLTDTRQHVGSENYAGTYTGNFSGNYVGDYIGSYVGSKTYSGTYAGDYTGNYTGSYSGVGTYSNTYAGDYTGNYAGSYSGPKTYSNTYAGSYTGNYAGGYYVGDNTYVGSYIGYFGGAYSNNFVGTSAYSGAYSGAAYTRTSIGWYPGTMYYGGYGVDGYFVSFYLSYYTGYFTGYYTGAKNYTGYYIGVYARNFIGYYTGTSAYAGVYSGTYTGYYANNYVGTSAYSGGYAGNYTGYYLGAAVGAAEYSGGYAGNYTGYYLGTSVGTSAYSDTYSGTYTGTSSRNFSGTYAGDTIQASTENVSTVKLWLKTA